MPGKTEHLARAEANARFCRLQVADGQFLDWAVAALFYSALHYVDAYLATRGPGGLHPRTHGIRTALVAKDPVLSAVRLQYEHLRTRSQDARYDLLSFAVADVDRLERNEFAAIRNLLRPLL